MSSIITAGDATNGASLTAGSNGTLILQSGLAGAKVNALTIDAAGAVTASGGVGIGGATAGTTSYGTYATPLRVTLAGGLPYAEIVGASNQAGLLFNRDGSTGWLTGLNAAGSLRIAPLGTIDQTGLTSAKDGTNGLTIDGSGNVGIGTTSPGTTLDIQAPQTNFDTNVFGNIRISSTTAFNAAPRAGIVFSIKYDSNNYGVGSSIQGYKVNATSGDFGQGILFTTQANGAAPAIRMTISSTGLAVTGALSCTGALSKGSGSFRVDHPLPELTATRQLVHSFIEGPKADLIYRGKVALVDGQATVNIDTVATMTEGTFEVLCRDVQCFTTNESDWICVRGKVIGNILTIEAEDITATSVVSWMVIGERQDPHMMETEWTDENGRVIVEPLKPVPPQTLEEPT